MSDENPFGEPVDPKPYMVSERIPEETPDEKAEETPVGNMPDLAYFLLNIVRQVAIIPLEQLEAHYNKAVNDRSFHDALGPIVDPTRYRVMLYDGSLDRAELQIEMVGHLLEIRRLADKHDAKVKKP